MSYKNHKEHDNLYNIDGGTLTERFHLLEDDYIFVTATIPSCLSSLQDQIDNIGTPNHNSLPDLQGGTVSQYFHLTTTQHTLVASLSTNDGNLVFNGEPIVGISAHASLTGIQPDANTQYHINSTIYTVVSSLSDSGGSLLYNGATVGGGVTSYASLSGIPASFSPTDHLHNYASLSGIPASFSPIDHLHTHASLTNIDGSTWHVTASQYTWLGQDVQNTASPTFAGLNITGDTTLHGNLSVLGTFATVNVQDLIVEDRLITLNAGEVGAGITGTFAGIEIDRGSEANYYFGYNDVTDTFQAGYEPSYPASLSNVAIWNTSPSFDIVTLNETIYNTTSTNANGVIGSVTWNPDEGTTNRQLTANVSLQDGRESLYFVTASGSITDGQLVMAVGTTGNSGNIIVKPFVPGTPSKYIVGIATENIADGLNGNVTHWGKVRGINTTGGAEAWVDGEILYASMTVSGGLTKLLPSPNYVKTALAIVIHTHSNGTLLVRINECKTVQDLCNIDNATLTLSDAGKYLQWNGSFYSPTLNASLSTVTITNLVGTTATINSITGTLFGSASLSSATVSNLRVTTAATITAIFGTFSTVTGGTITNLASASMTALRFVNATYSGTLFGGGASLSITTVSTLTGTTASFSTATIGTEVVRTNISSPKYTGYESATTLTAKFEIVYNTACLSIDFNFL